MYILGSNLGACISACEDPKVEGVELYISDFERPITERLQANLGAISDILGLFGTHFGYFRPL